MKIKQWDYSKEGIVCPVCKGKGEILQTRDMHRSAGIIPCPAGYFQGHGFPTCVGGKLHFDSYDRKNEKKLKKDKNLIYKTRSYDHLMR